MWQQKSAAGIAEQDSKNGLISMEEQETSPVVMMRNKNWALDQNSRSAPAALMTPWSSQAPLQAAVCLRCVLTHSCICTAVISGHVAIMQVALSQHQQQQYVRVLCIVSHVHSPDYRARMKRRSFQGRMHLHEEVGCGEEAKGQKQH